MELAKTTLYEFNKANMAQIKPLEILFLNGRCIEAAKSFDSKYTMLLSNEKKDYTVFNNISMTKEGLGKELFELLNSRGKVTDFTRQENGAWEIWVRYPDNEDVLFYYFDYDWGVVEA